MNREPLSAGRATDANLIAAPFRSGRACCRLTADQPSSVSILACPTKISGSRFAPPDQARTDFAIIEDELEAIQARLARLPSRGQLWRVCLIGMLGGSVLTTALGLAFVLH